MRLSNLQEAITCNSLPILSILRFLVPLASLRSNETKMSDGGRGRASIAVEVWKSSQKWSVRRSAVRSIALLGGLCCTRVWLTNPGIFGRISPSAPTDGQIGELQH